MKKTLLSQYYGVISCGIYDDELKKKIAKVEINSLVDFLDKKLERGEYTLIKSNDKRAHDIVKFI